MTTTTTNYGFLKYGSGETPWSHSSGLDAIDGELARPRPLVTSPTVGATTTCDLSLSRVFKFTVSQATTLAFTNVPTSTFGVPVDLIITNGAAFTFTFPASVTWLFGVVPTFQTSGVDRVRMLTVDGGTTWYAAHFGKNLSASGTIKAGMGTSGSLVSAMGTAAGGVSFSVTNSGAGSPANLKSYVIPANSLVTDGDYIRAFAYGLFTNNVNAKVARINLGGTLIGSVAAQVSVLDTWWLDAYIFRTGATTANTIVSGLSNGTGIKTATLTLPGPTWSGGVTIQWDCTQVGAGDVAQYGFLVQHGRFA